MDDLGRWGGAKWGRAKPRNYFGRCARGLNSIRRIVAFPEANREWCRALTAVAGVYLIVDAATGLQYVGSAAGAGGIMGRWQEYAASGHGGNAKLRDLLEKNPRAAERFQFTVLRVLEKTITRNEVIGFEQHYKEKLGSRAFGLNSN